MLDKKKVCIHLKKKNVMPADNFFIQYNKQHITPLEDVKLQSLDNDGRKLSSRLEFC